MGFSSKDEQIKHRESDEWLKPLFFDKIFQGQDLFRNDQLYAAFKTFSGLFLFIQGRDLPLKPKILKQNQIIKQYFDMLNGKPANKYEQLQIGQTTKTLHNLIEEYITDVMISMDHLGLFLRTITVHTDLHRNLSDQNFGDDFSSLKQYKEVLKKLDSEEILDKLTSNMVYHVYALWRYDNAV